MTNDINTRARLIFAALLLLAAGAATVWYLVSASQYVTYQLYTRDPVSGLLADAPVEFHGVEVGKVKSIELLSAQSVRIALRVVKSAPVTRASIATITSRGLATRGFTGYVFVALEDVGTDAQPLLTPPGEAFPVIPTAPSKVVTLDTTINQVNDNARVIAELLTTLLDKKTMGSLKESADSLQRVLPEAQKALSALTELQSRLQRDPSILLRGAAPPPPGPGERK